MYYNFLILEVTELTTGGLSYYKLDKDLVDKNKKKRLVFVSVYRLFYSFFSLRTFNSSLLVLKI